MRAPGGLVRPEQASLPTKHRKEARPGSRGEPALLPLIPRRETMSVQSPLQPAERSWPTTAPRPTSRD